MAIDALATLVTTTANERVLSESDDIINNDRARLYKEVAEQTVALKT